MATADQWSSADLKGIADGGLINEDVMQQIWEIDPTDVPLSEMISSDTVDNSYTEWTQDSLAAPNLNNARVDGEDTINNNDAKGGARVGNHCQISTKNVSVTTRARQSDTIARSDELAYQLMQRQKEARIDVEAISLTGQGSQTDDGDTVPGLAGALGAWISTHYTGGTGGAAGGFTGGQVTAQTAGEARALTETEIRDTAQAVWEDGGNPSVLMSTPSVIRRISEYMFTDAARIATLQSDVGQEQTDQVAKGSVNVFVTDFGVTMRMIPNRQQQTYQSSDGTPVDVSNLYYIDPELIRHGFLHGYRVEPLSKTGLADKRQLAVDWTLKVLQEKGLGLSADINGSLPVTQS